MKISQTEGEIRISHIAYRTFEDGGWRMECFFVEVNGLIPHCSFLDYQTSFGLLTTKDTKAFTKDTKTLVFDFSIFIIQEIP